MRKASDDGDERPPRHPHPHSHARNAEAAGEPEDDARPRRQHAVLRDTRAVYRLADAAYAPYSCPASGECCQLAVTQRQPWLWLPEWLVLKDHLRKQGRGLPSLRPDGACPFLDGRGRRCTVYEDRPFGCRTYFCARLSGPAHQPLEDVIRLSRRLEVLSLEMDANLTGPRELLSWIDKG